MITNLHYNTIIKWFVKPVKPFCWKKNKEANGKAFQKVLLPHNHLLLVIQTAQALLLFEKLT